MSEGTDASEAPSAAPLKMKKKKTRQISAVEKAILMQVVPVFNAAATRSQERRDCLDNAVVELNKLNPENEWDIKRLRVWIMNHRDGAKTVRKLGRSTGSLTSSFASGGMKRAIGGPDERFSKRSNSFSQFDSGSGAQSGAPKPLDTDKLSSFFQLEHSRLPRDPLLIFHVTNGDELSSQLSFNWLLEERIAGTCEVLEKIENRGPLVASDGSVAVTSKIDPFVAVIGAAASSSAAAAAAAPAPAPSPHPGGTAQPWSGSSSDSASPGFVVNNTITPQPPALLLPQPDEKCAMLFFDDEEEDLVEYDDHLDAEERAVSPKHGGEMRDLVHMEPTRDEDSGGLEPMHLAEVGRAAAVREGNATLVYAACRFAIGGAELTRSGKLVLASRRVEGVAVNVCEVTRDAIALKEASLPMPWLDAAGPEESGGLASAVVLDETRSTFWVNAGKYVAGYDLNSVGRGPLFRLLPDRSHAVPGAPMPMVARKNFLCVGVGSWINVWDLEEVETASSSDMSSSMYESVSCSEGEGSPPLGGENHYLGPERFAKELSKKYCRSCNKTVFERGVEKRDCSECRTQVCSECVHMYKLTSLGETGVRAICNTCIPSIRKRILAQQQSSRMPQLVERERAGSLCQRRDVAPHQQHEVVKRNYTYRSVGLLAADYTDNDRLLLSFDKRQCALTWSLEHAQELRWFVGHTGAITALASCEAQPTMLGTGSADHTAKIWDARVRAPTLTLRGHSGPVSAMCLVSFDSTQSFCFTGGLDEVIKVWDLRMQQPLYELSTGNTRPRYLSWNAGTSSLLCTATTGYTSPAWPQHAVHAPEHFPKVFHCNSNAVLQYDFTSLL